MIFSLKEQAAKLEEFEMTKQKRSKKEEDKSVEEKSTLHGKSLRWVCDYVQISELWGGRGGVCKMVYFK